MKCAAEFDKNPIQRWRTYREMCRDRRHCEKCEKELIVNQKGKKLKNGIEVNSTNFHTAIMGKK